jgi:hypothetical protein
MCEEKAEGVTITGTARREYFIFTHQECGVDIEDMRFLGMEDDTLTDYHTGRFELICPKCSKTFVIRIFLTNKLKRA